MSLKIKKISIKLIIAIVFGCQMTIPFFLGAQWANAITPDLEMYAILGAGAHALLLCALMAVVAVDLKE